MAITTILTHPGGAHKDELLACCAARRRPRCREVVRREPDRGGPGRPRHRRRRCRRRARPGADELRPPPVPRRPPAGLRADPGPPAPRPLRGCPYFLRLAGTRRVVRHPRPERHRQVARRRPRHACNKLNSPVDRHPAPPLRQGLAPRPRRRGLGNDALHRPATCIDYVRSLRQRLDFIAAHAELWTVGGHEILFLPRTEPLPDEPSSGLARHLDAIGKGKDVVALVYPDRRGSRLRPVPPQRPPGLRLHPHREPSPTSTSPTPAALWRKRQLRTWNACENCLNIRELKSDAANCDETFPTSVTEASPATD
jgi:hypothetical protein